MSPIKLESFDDYDSSVQGSLCGAEGGPGISKFHIPIQSELVSTRMRTKKQSLDSWYTTRRRRVCRMAFKRERRNETSFRIQNRLSLRLYFGGFSRIHSRRRGRYATINTQQLAFSETRDVIRSISTVPLTYTAHRNLTQKAPIVHHIQGLPPVDLTLWVQKPWSHTVTSSDKTETFAKDNGLY